MDNSQNMECEYNIKDHMKFEIKSFLGRLFLARYPKPTNEIKLLNLGCGKEKQEGWINADFFRFRKKNRPDWMLDLRFPLRCQDNYWDGIFSEHTLEHLYPRHVEMLLSELYRTLKPKCWIRLSVPDLEKYVDFYTGKQVHEEFIKKWGYPGYAIRRVSQDFLHVSLWDAFMLKSVLENAGFVKIQKTSYYQGSEPRLFIEQKDREYESLYMEAQKPL